MRALAEFSIAIIDLIRAELRTGWRAAVRRLVVVVALLLTLLIGALLIIGGVGLMLGALFSALDTTMPTAAALLLTGFAAMLAAGGCAWIVTRNVSRK